MRKILFLLLFISFAKAHSQTTCTDPGPTPGQTGCVTFIYGGQSATYTTVRAKDGNIWIQQNLGAQTVAQSASDAQAFGDLFQWGRWDDGHQKTTSPTNANAPAPNNPTGLGPNNANFYISNPSWWQNSLATDTWSAATPEAVTGTDGCDPCKALGAQWHVPSLDEWTAVIDEENITNIASALQSNLKLATAGSRKETGSFSFVGQRGYYWSSTPSASNPSFTKYLYYSDFIVNPEAGAVRGQGSSMRCLKAGGPAYCEVGVDFDIEPISRFVFANIDNATSAAVNATPAYEDYTAITAQVNAGQAYDFSVEGNTNGPFEHDIRLFFDWNHDGTFDMDSEYYPFVLLPSDGEDGISASGQITIPADATRGTTRMRIVKDMWNVYEPGEFDACTNAYYGQIEDYSVNVQDALGHPDMSRNTFSVYPNPALDHVFIASVSEIESATVITLQGQAVKRSATGEIELSGLPAGIYLVKIQFADGQSAVSKIAKQ